jgi:hypothetical protein
MNIQFFSKKLLHEDTQDNNVVFSVNNGKLDDMLNSKFASELDYIEDKGDTHYSMSQYNYDRFVDLAMSSGFDVDEDIDENPMGYDYDTLDEEGSTTSAVPGIATKLGANPKGSGWTAAPSKKNRPSKGGFIYKDLWAEDQELNENYSRFRKETKTRSEAQQYHEAIKAAHKKIDEANKILEYSQRLKEEFPYQNTGMHETKSITKKAIDKLKQKVADSYKKIKKLEL